MTHSPDCAMVLYADIDPRTLKKPLECDGVECDGQDDGEPVFPIDEPRPTETVDNVRPIRSGADVTLTGDAARTYKALQAAEGKLRAAQKVKDEALRAFLEAVTR